MTTRLTVLPDTAIAAIANDEDIFTYAQLYYGELAESRSKDGKKFRTKVIDYTSWDTVKLFTPLAATLFNRGTTRYLFYLDHANVINDLVYENGKWRVGDLGRLGVVTAHYSKLAAVTLQDPAETIYVFYQTSDKAGDIREVRGYDGNWQSDTHDFGDPPLFGTSLAAVQPEPGVTIHSPAGDSIPVVFFQEDNLKLAELQAQDFRELKPITPKPSPHTPLAAVDDGNNAYLFYTSDENEIRRITIGWDGQQLGPLSIAATTPKGNIAAVIWKGKILGGVEEIIVFYQPQTSNTITQTISDPNVLAAASSTLIGSGKSRTLSAPVISDVVLHFE